MGALVDSVPTLWRKLIFASFVATIATIVIMTSIVSQRGIHIESDLQSLSPHYITDPEVEAAAGRLGDTLQQDVLLVLKSDSRDEIEQILDELPQILSALKLEHLDYVDAEDNLEQTLDLIERYRFYFLTDSQAHALQSLSDEQLLQQAQRQLFSLAGSARLFDLKVDPMGFANAYALNVLESLPGAGQAEIIGTVKDNSETFYAPLRFFLRANAQDFQQQSLVQNEITRLENTLIAINPDIKLLHSGVFFFSANAASNAKADIALISTGSSVGILLLLLYFFRSLRAIVLPLISVALGVAFAFLVCQLLFDAIHVFTIVFGASLIGVVIDYAIHYAYHYGKQRDSSTVTNLYRALLLSLLTSAIGYGALMFSGLAVLKQVAAFSVLGLTSAWLTVVALGPVLLSQQQGLHDEGLRKILRGVLGWLGAVNGKIFLAAYGVVILAGVAIIVTQIQFGDSPRGFFEPDPRLVAEEAELQEVLSNFEPATYLVIRGDSEQAVYDELNQLLQAQPGLQETLFGAHTLMASPQQRQQAYQLNDRLYRRDGLATTFLRELEVAPATIEELVAHYRTASNNPPTAALLLDGAALPTPPLWQQMAKRHYSFFLLSKQTDASALNDYAQNRENVFFIDTIGMSTNAIQALRQSANGLLAFALLLISVLMVIRYRQIARLDMMMVPVAAIVVTLAVFALSGVAVSLFHMMALFLVLGLGMDYVIFITDLREHNQDTLCAVLLSAVTSLLAFGLLSLSQLPVVQAFGLTVLIGNTVNIIGGFFLAGFYQQRLRSKMRDG